MLTTIVGFGAGSGQSPTGGLSSDSLGDVFGTTAGGGTGLNGTSASLNGTNGSDPMSDPIEDSVGNLFGSSAGGGNGDACATRNLAAPLSFASRGV